MSTDLTQKTIMARVAIVVVLLAAAAGILYAKHVRATDNGGKAIAPSCPCSAHKPVTPGQ